MSRFYIGSVFAVVMGSLVFGCAEGAPAKKNPTYDPALDDSRDDADDVKASSSSSSGSPGSEVPLEETPGSAPSDRTDPEEETPSTPPTTPTDPPGTDPPATPAGAQKANCTSTTDGHKSVAEATYTIANGAIKISKLTIAITNKDNRDQNDIDFWLTPSPGAKEAKAFNSGDTLPNAKTTPVTIPASVSIKTGAKVRIETNFDTSFTDPHASCNIQF